MGFPHFAILEAKKIMDNVDPPHKLLGWIEFISKMFHSDKFKDYEEGKI